MGNSDVTLAYLAGIIDEEGCVCLAHCARKDVSAGYVTVLKLHVAMTKDTVPVWLHNIFGGNLSLSKRRFKNPKWSDAYCWQLQSIQAANLLREVRPFLKLKREQASLALEFQAVKSGRGRGKKKLPLQIETEKGFSDRMHRLNALGGKIRT